MTEFDREKDVPSGFCLKLRKHIRARRLDAVHQLGDGGDRILDLVFSSEGKTCAHLIVEAFSGGNVILTDGEYTILTLLRAYRITDGDGGSRVAVREKYPTSVARRPSKIDRDLFHAAALRALQSVPDEDAIAAATGRGARKRLQAKGIARKALAVELALEPCLLEHSLLEAGLDTEISMKDICSEDKVERTFQCLQALEKDIEALVKRGKMKGYIVFSLIDVDGESKEQYEDFGPYLFAQYKQKRYKEFDSFDKAADEFFSSLEAKRAEAAQAKRQAAAYKKVDKLAAELKGQVAVFETARDVSWELAQAIENNASEVEAAITVIRSAIAASVSWDELAKMVEDEKKKGNPVAEIIHSLQLEKNEVTLMLEDSFGMDEDDTSEQEEETAHTESEEDDSDDSDDFDQQRVRGKAMQSTRQVLLVSVDLDLGAYANARRYYDQRKNAASKIQRASSATDRTLKAATRKAATEAKKLQAEAASASIRARRKPLWFEKFYWFVSSENYLIVAGRDAQQNELLVKRYLGPADAYVHADVTGAASVIVKNRKQPGATTHSDIPQITLEQAGVFAMCRSAAWDAKMVTSAWWVRAMQVSKTALSGEYLPVGSFSIRGKKVFLDPTQLIMGLAFLFKVDETCVANHKDERTVRGIHLLQAVKQEEPPDQDHIQGLEEDEVISEKTSKDTDEGDATPMENTSKTDEGLPVNKMNVSSEEEDVEEDSPSSGALASQNNESSGGSSGQEAVFVSEGLPSSGASSGVPEIAIDKSKKTIPRAKKRHMSAKERKSLRNPRIEGTETTPTEHTHQIETASPDAVAKPPSERNKSTASAKATGPLPRGRKHKLKKLKKYKDQDEEERRIALQILGSKPIKEQDVVQDAGTDGNRDGYEDVVDKDPSTKFRESQSRREERQEPMRLLEKEGLIELKRLEEETVSVLDMLTATLVVGDEVQYALPICAPYSALSNYRYKAKLMPGNTKRGKAYRTAVALFIKQAEKDLTIHKQERDAIRVSPESDGIHGMLGNVKIMAPGLAEAQKSIQKTKKGTGAKKGKKKS